MRVQLKDNFEKIVSVENLLEAWKEFEKGKRGRKDVQEFSLRLMDNIFSLHYDLSHHTYKHGGYQAFRINDLKPRDIHKASVRDRLLHHAIYRILYPFLRKHLLQIHTLAGLKRGRIKRLIDSEISRIKSARTIREPAGF